MVSVCIVTVVKCVRDIPLHRGVEFRKSYKGELRALVDVPFMALTASASPSVVADITSTLHLNSPYSGLDRPNIYLSANPLQSLSVSGIVLIISHKI